MPCEKALVNLGKLPEGLRFYGRFGLWFCGGGEDAVALLVSVKRQVQSQYMLALRSKYAHRRKRS